MIGPLSELVAAQAFEVARALGWRVQPVDQHLAGAAHRPLASAAARPPDHRTWLPGRTADRRDHRKLVVRRRRSCPQSRRQPQEPRGPTGTRRFRHRLFQPVAPSHAAARHDQDRPQLHGDRPRRPRKRRHRQSGDHACAGTLDPRHRRGARRCRHLRQGCGAWCAHRPGLVRRQADECRRGEPSCFTAAPRPLPPPSARSAEPFPILLVYQSETPAKHAGNRSRTAPVSTW